jgi:tRNA A-37 threonylcarbamoyl transferase component Bud32
MDSGGMDLHHLPEFSFASFMTRREVALQLIDPVAMLHKQGIAHGDLAGHNVVWKEDQKCLRLIDFNSCLFLRKDGEPCVKACWTEDIKHALSWIFTRLYV